mmetsp:Transcript_19003/g.44326  ORF Transcript_19003/g.44326 Transcript_19003/m.44326 type:complete len:332 (-) Transcript_19003:171-1166(-)
MPHCRSVASRHRRHERARQAGFLCGKPLGCSYVLVPTGLAERAKAIVRSLQLHDQHMRVVGEPAHFASTASLRARPLIGDGAYKHARAVHKAANEAKHMWPSRTLISLNATIPLMSPLPHGLPLRRMDVDACERPGEFVPGKAVGDVCCASVQTDEHLLDGFLEQSISGLQSMIDKEVRSQMENVIADINHRWTERLQHLQQQVDDLKHSAASGKPVAAVHPAVHNMPGMQTENAKGCEPLYVRVDRDVDASADAGCFTSPGMGESRNADGEVHFFPGMTVILHGLQKKAALNGSFGCICGWDATSGRWKVELPGDEVPILVKSENLRYNG